MTGHHSNHCKVYIMITFKTIPLTIIMTILLTIFVTTVLTIFVTTVLTIFVTTIFKLFTIFMSIKEGWFFSIKDISVDIEGRGWSASEVG